jgi:penicillin-binding protein 1A
MKPLNFLIIICIITVILAAIIGLYVNSIIGYGLPSLEQLENPKTNLATKIFSSDGKLLDHFFKERRVNLTYDSIPKDFLNALIATEDKNFRHHWGVHVGRVINAAIKGIFFGDVEGASTITMQLSRNLFLTQEFNFQRKIREAFLAIQIERTYTKEEILEMYANTVGFGRGAYGLEVASQVYFDKDPLELSTSECALLVALLKAPSNYNPVTNYDKALNRRNLVLRLMSDQGYLTPDKFTKSIREPINVFTSSDKKVRRNTVFSGGIAPHFVEMVRQELGKNSSLTDYDLYRDGLSIYTTIDSRIQQYANEAVMEHLSELQQTFEKNWIWWKHKDLLDELIKKAIGDRADYRASDKSEKDQIAKKLRSNKKFIDSVKNAAGTIQVGLVVINPANGAILAMVGASPKFMKDNPSARYALNHATQIKRQPGSSFKPFVYTCALKEGCTPTTMIECGPFSYKLETGEVWSPSGDGGCAPGEKVSLTDGLRLSINTVSARLVTSKIHPVDVVNLARSLGITTPLSSVPAISLGAGGDVIPIELISAYGAFVYNGLHIEPYFYEKIEDRFNSIIKQKSPGVNITEAMRSEIAIQMTYLMEGVVNAGTASRAIRSVFTDIDAAGKTGTTNDAADAWFVGFTPQLVAGVWLGFDNKKITLDVLGAEGYGGRSAAPIWGLLMKKIYADYSLPFKQKKFSYKKAEDSTLSNITPYPLTELQQQNKDNSKSTNGAKVQATTPILPPMPVKKN